MSSDAAHPRQEEDVHQEPRERLLVDFAWLRAQGIVKDWSGLRRLVQHHGLPPGRMLSGRKRVWLLTEILDFINSRPAYAGPQLRGGAKANVERAAKKRGRP